MSLAPRPRVSRRSTRCARAGDGQPSETDADTSHVVPLLGERRITVVSGTIDDRIRRLAALQRLRVARRQLIAAGVDGSAIDRRLRSRDLVAVHRGVYALAATVEVDVPLAAETAALLAVREGSVLSHLSAALLWGLCHRGDDLIHIRVPGDGPAARVQGVRVHRSGEIERTDTRLRDGLPVTAPTRTIVDVAATPLSTRELELMIEQGLVRRLTSTGELERELAHRRRQAGTARLRAVLNARSSPTLTRSEAEERFLALVRGAGLPAPRVNHRLHGYEVDFVWLRERVVVEIDGYAFHSTHRAFHADYRRDAVLRAHGFTVLRFTWTQVTQEALMVAAQVAQALGAAR